MLQMNTHTLTLTHTHISHIIPKFGELSMRRELVRCHFQYDIDSVWIWISIWIRTVSILSDVLGTPKVSWFYFCFICNNFNLNNRRIVLSFRERLLCTFSEYPSSAAAHFNNNSANIVDFVFLFGVYNDLGGFCNCYFERSVLFNFYFFCV